MNEKISIENREIFTNYQNRGSFSNHVDSFETVRECPEDLGKGFIREIELRPEFKLVIEDFRFLQNLLFNDEVEPSPLDFSFCVLGRCKGTLRGAKDDLIMNPGESSLFYAPEVKGTMEYPAGERMLFVIVWVKPPAFQSFIGGEFDQIPADLRSTVDGSDKNLFNRIGSMTASMKMTVHQILNCPYQGLIKRMYLEGKAIELISHQLAQLVCDEKVPKTLILRPDDIERIHEARDILIRNMDNPPSLLELARQVGLNDTKLKRGFRQIFNTTVFGCLHAQRMERAILLLQDGKVNVTEVAYEVGYSSPGNFTRAFARHFGCNPLSCLRDACTDIPLN
jgi:AraC-like DNA-binding protein